MAGTELVPAAVSRNTEDPSQHINIFLKPQGVMSTSDTEPTPSRQVVFNKQNTVPLEEEACEIMNWKSQNGGNGLADVVQGKFLSSLYSQCNRIQLASFTRGKGV